MSEKLTALITCKNERTNIGPCLDSVAGIANELLVADSGSTDGTLGYLRARGDCRIIYGDYTTSGDFKNWAIPHATHPWVLILDSDERVTPRLATEIKDLLEKGPEHDGFWVGRTNHLMGHRVRYTDWARDRLVRLFRRDLGRYEGPSDHGDVVVSSGKVGVLRSPLDHYTIWSWSHYMAKFDRYTRVQAEHWHAAGRKPSWRRMLVQPPLRFLRDYVMHLGFLDGSVGIQIAWTSAFYSFMKQARLWELHNARKQADVEGEAMAASEAKATPPPKSAPRKAA
jgi:glycosyltransferase involved in cell wall biosynthesis